MTIVCVYFVQVVHDDGTRGPIKIGISQPARLRSRVMAIQTACPYEVEVLAVLRDVPRQVEKILHSRFHKSHLRGEWFKPTTELKTLIREVAWNHGGDEELREDIRAIYELEREWSEMTS